MGKVRVQSGQIHHWGEGVNIEGIYLGWREISVQGRPGFLVDFEVNGRKVTYGCPAMLKSTLDNVGVGVAVEVQCKGKGKTAGGQDLWLFEVYRIVPGEGERLPGEPEPDLPF